MIAVIISILSIVVVIIICACLYISYCERQDRKWRVPTERLTREEAHKKMVDDMFADPTEEKDDE